MSLKEVKESEASLISRKRMELKTTIELLRSTMLKRIPTLSSEMKGNMEDMKNSSGAAMTELAAFVTTLGALQPALLRLRIIALYKEMNSSYTKSVAMIHKMKCLDKELQKTRKIIENKESGWIKRMLKGKGIIKEFGTIVINYRNQLGVLLQNFDPIIDLIDEAQRILSLPAAA